MQISGGKRIIHIVTVLLIALIVFFIAGWGDNDVCAQPVQIPEVEFRIGGNEEEDPGELVGILQLLLIMALLSLAPAFIVLMTSFTRIVVVMGFVRNALATQQIPPNQVLVGLALFFNIFHHVSCIWEVNEQAIQPYLEGR